MSREYLFLANGRPRADLDHAYPPFLKTLLDVLAECAARGQPYYLVADYSGPHTGGLFRSIAAQDWLFAQGRTRAGAKVTNARGWESCHNFGLGADVTADADATREGLQPSWDWKRYTLLGEIARRRGLVWGGDWGDRPHIQWPSYVRASHLFPLRRAALSAGVNNEPRVWLAAAWKIVSERYPNGLEG